MRRNTVRLLSILLVLLLSLDGASAQSKKRGTTLAPNHAWELGLGYEVISVGYYHMLSNKSQVGVKATLGFPSAEFFSITPELRRYYPAFWHKTDKFKLSMLLYAGMSIGSIPRDREGLYLAPSVGAGVELMVWRIYFRPMLTLGIVYDSKLNHISSAWNSSFQHAHPLALTTFGIRF